MVAAELAMLSDDVLVEDLTLLGATAYAKSARAGLNRYASTEGSWVVLRVRETLLPTAWSMRDEETYRVVARDARSKATGRVPAGEGNNGWACECD